MDTNTNLGNRSGAGGLVAGFILITLGAMFLAGQLLRIDFGHYLWPFFILIPGTVFLLMALLSSNQAGEPLAMVSGIILMAGMLLSYQNLSGHWASWAYAWALVAPTGPGLGLLVYGAVKGQPQKVKAGSDLALTGVAIFLVGAAFFELVIGISGFGLGRYGWPLLLIGLGVIGVVRAFLPRRSRA